ncbi:uncharacterized protein METZ01_LOCUS67670 [marine metagenome]|uniref:Uncharacterized protein n=1 Tax=marine metagenome TaxID=408172 RepID=A0A381TFB6_9ZZZZ
MVVHRWNFPGRGFSAPLRRLPKRLRKIDTLYFVRDLKFLAEPYDAHRARSLDVVDLHVCYLHHLKAVSVIEVQASVVSRCPPAWSFKVG